MIFLDSYLPHAWVIQSRQLALLLLVYLPIVVVCLLIKGAFVILDKLTPILLHLALGIVPISIL